MARLGAVHAPGSNLEFVGSEKQRSQRIESYEDLRVDERIESLENRDAHPTIERNEIILRRILKIHYQPDVIDSPFSVETFRPSSADDDGLSFFREKFITPFELASSGNKPAHDYVVAKFLAGDLFNLGLSLKITYEEDDLPGHVVIPELSKSNYKRNRIFCKEIHATLAKLAQLNVVTDFP